MAWGASKTSARQTATNVAGSLAAAGFTLEDVKENFEAIRDYIFTDLSTFVDQEAKDAPPARSGGGQRSGGSNSNSSDPGSIEFRFGAFKGSTIAEVAELSAADADKKTEGRYTKSGVTYLEWVANNKDPKASFMQKQAEAFLDARRAG